MKKLLYLFIFYPLMLSAQTLEPEYKTAIGNYLTTVARKEISVGKIKIDSVAVEKKTVAALCEWQCILYSFQGG